MEMLPPRGWDEVATKADIAGFRTEVDARLRQIDARFDGQDLKLDALTARLESRIDRAFQAQTWRLMALFIALASVLVAAVRL